jgi:hypothetical protein
VTAHDPLCQLLRSRSGHAGANHWRTVATISALSSYFGSGSALRAICGITVGRWWEADGGRVVIGGGEGIARVVRR